MWVGKVLAGVLNSCIIRPWAFNVALRHRENIYFYLTEEVAGAQNWEMNLLKKKKSHIWEVTWPLFELGVLQGQQ